MEKFVDEEIVKEENEEDQTDVKGDKDQNNDIIRGAKLPRILGGHDYYEK